MDVMTALLTRRSVRNWNEEPVSRQDLEQIIKAAMFAPSAGNQQPWHFVAIDKRELLDKVPEAHPYASMATQAQAGVLVCGHEDVFKHPEFWMEDCAAATQNLLLAAHGLGLGAVWLGVAPKEERMGALRGLLSLPEKAMPFALVLMGHPVKEPKQPDRFRAERMHFNQW